MEANVKIQSADKSAEKWKILAEKLKNLGCKYSRLQTIREGFLVFLIAYEDLSRLTTNETISDLSINGFSVVVSQKIVSKKTVIIRNVDKTLFQKNEDQLVFELTRCNQWLKV